MHNFSWQLSQLIFPPDNIFMPLCLIHSYSLNFSHKFKKNKIIITKLKSKILETESDEFYSWSRRSFILGVRGVLFPQSWSWMIYILTPQLCQLIYGFWILQEKLYSWLAFRNTWYNTFLTTLQNQGLV